MSEKKIVMNDHQATLGKTGLTMALSTIIFADLYALFAAAARMPGIYEWLPSMDFFHIALVTHVNLAIVIWFSAFCGLLCLLSRIIPQEPSRTWRMIAWTGTFCSTLGMVLIVIAPFVGAENPVMANYIPVLDHPLFFTALFLVFLGVMLTMSLPFIAANKEDSLPLHPDFSFGMKLTGMTFLIAMVCLILALVQIPPSHSLPYFETVFWGSGHILQFVNTLALLSCWILLYYKILGEIPLPSWCLRGLLALITLFALPAPLFYFIFDVQGPKFIAAFTFLMRWGLGVSTILIGGSIVLHCIRHRSLLSWKDPLLLSLLVSIGLFGYGGVIGALLNNSDVKIPAHYHGVIGAVTLAFMGTSYVIIPVMGKVLHQTRLIIWQPILCGGGGVFFVTGLFWAGSHGVARKVAGAGQGLDNIGKILGMSLMGIGGLVTFFGLLVFLYVVFKSLYPKRVFSPVKTMEKLSSPSFLN
ncbi:MAG: cbb3-type cytochrome c oxidase subunit I [SAR324 cluster bacterium]|nr:cbb3-type cytochrome c oxidase subunit I [SAR324 cluster bacterium]